MKLTFKQFLLEMADVRSPNGEEYDRVKAALKAENPKLRPAALGVNVKTGDINIEDSSGEEWILRKKTGKLELRHV